MLNHIWLSFSGANIVFGNVWFVAAIWMALALVASLVSIRIGISVALIEIFIGVIAGNFLHLTASNEWINFLALLGSGVLTFLAGAEIDPRSLKANLRASVLIGVLSFAVVAYRVLVLRHLEATPLVFLMVLFSITGILSLFIGFLADIVIRGFYDTQRKPTYYVRETVGVHRPD